MAYHQSEHLRLNGIYWGLTALYIMGRQDALDREEMIQVVMSCWDDKQGESHHEEGGGEGGDGELELTRGRHPADRPSTCVTNRRVWISSET